MRCSVVISYHVWKDGGPLETRFLKQYGAKATNDSSVGVFYDSVCLRMVRCRVDQLDVVRGEETAEFATDKAFVAIGEEALHLDAGVDEVGDERDKCVS